MGIQFNGNTDTISTNDGTLNVTPQTTFGGEVGIAGTLTYEDVTNIDSVGIVTARNGLKVTGGTSHFVGVANFNETIVGTARTALKLTCTDESTDTTTYPLFVAASTGDQFPKTGTNLTFNSASGLLAATQLSGSIQTAAQPNITSVGTLTALTVDDVAINGKVITMTGDTDDTAVFTLSLIHI